MSDRPTTWPPALLQPDSGNVRICTFGVIDQRARLSGRLPRRWKSVPARCTCEALSIGIWFVNEEGTREGVSSVGRIEERHLQTASSAFPEENLGRETRDPLDKMTASSQCTIGNAPWSFAFMAAYQSRQQGREPELERKGALSCLPGVSPHANWAID